jgi:hypothetical protein
MPTVNYRLVSRFVRLANDWRFIGVKTLSGVDGEILASHTSSATPVNRVRLHALFVHVRKVRRPLSPRISREHCRGKAIFAPPE